MSEDRLPLAELLAKAGDSDFMRSAAKAVAQSLMETDVESLIGAGGTSARPNGRRIAIVSGTVGGGKDASRDQPGLSISRGYPATQAGIKTLFVTAADLVLLPQAVHKTNSLRTPGKFFLDPKKTIANGRARRSVNAAS